MFLVPAATRFWPRLKRQVLELIGLVKDRDWRYCAQTLCMKYLSCLWRVKVLLSKVDNSHFPLYRCEQEPLERSCVCGDLLAD